MCARLSCLLSNRYAFFAEITKVLYIRTYTGSYDEIDTYTFAPPAREFERRRGVSLRLVLTTDVTDVPFVCAVRAVAAGAGGANVYLF